MLKKLITFSALLATSQISMAVESHDTICSNNGQQRIIQVVYPAAPADTPCEVHYGKDGESKILWQAKNQSGFCEEKADAFILKQQAWGWDCSAKAENGQSAPVKKDAILKTNTNKAKVPTKATIIEKVKEKLPNKTTVTEIIEDKKQDKTVIKEDPKVELPNKKVITDKIKEKIPEPTQLDSINAK